ncbi:hypothetical protein [Legionella clemsonensis]|uniref:Uncharacterized protein n=1 Tax=Legionella clemsonensis TaxID=1867846 RepID=A0A222P4X5_9GAMM|nr:hypothetical protein [Legionella clemsonensis]ASQ46899.1 hypothetical protein clem_11810 [Legionella clemsonensis]
MPAESAKKLLVKYNQRQYQEFLTDEATVLYLPAVSAVPWIGAADRDRVDVYEKAPYKFGEHQVNFISKNGEPYSFQWQTNAQRLKQAVRWGIVRTESITGKVIAALGNYRITAHERVAKGMISNTQRLKLQLLDHYQQRFEALQELESLVNKENSLATYSAAIEGYIQQLVTIRSKLEGEFSDTQLLALTPEAIRQLHQDIAEDIAKAECYLRAMTEKVLNNPQALRDYNRARGENSILHFIKQQMSDNLYQMQGINQDISYSKKRHFALTRGSLNDCIEDARREIEEHKADPRNAITAEHHGLYTSENGSVTYDFGRDNLTPARQRQVLLGISFIEGWDTVDDESEKPIVKNQFGSEPLSVIAATNWQLHRNFGSAIKSAAFFVVNIFKGMLTYTHPWEEEAWENQQFHLIAKILREKASLNEPLLLKPIKFIKALMYALKDCFRGIRNLGTDLFHIPELIFDDWKASKPLKDFDTVIKDAEKSLAWINEKEAERLQYILGSFSSLKNDAKPVSLLAKTDYPLTAGEQNDILTAMVRGFDGFVSVFTHNIYAKDPVAGLIFTTAYAAGAAVIFYPALSSVVFGTGYVNWLTNFSYSMGSGKLAAALAGGSTQAQVFATGWDTAIHGPNGAGVTVAMQIAEDPLTYGSYFALAYGLGYVLVNGINGHKIPVLSDILHEDLGSTPEASYPFIGGKFALAGYELFHRDSKEELHPVHIKFNGTEHKDYPKYLIKSNEQVITRFLFARWLAIHAETLPKLESTILFEIERHLDRLFSAEDAASLKKILYPEKEPTIAFQLFSIPLTYIPAICRFCFAFILSPLAWYMGNPEPAQPIKRASSDLYAKISKDLNRLLIAGSQLMYGCFKVLASPIKALAFTTNMLISRIAALADWLPAHSIHQYFARIHSFFNNLGEWMYPARATKSVIFAHPVHTIKAVEHSYKRMLEQLETTPLTSDLTFQQEKLPAPLSLNSPIPEPPPSETTNSLVASI